MSHILMPDPFLFPPSGEELTSLDIPTYSDPPENFFEFTKTQFEELWKIEADLFVSGSRSFDLFNAEEQNYESDSGISASSPSGLSEMEMSMDFSENIYGVTDHFTDLVSFSSDSLMGDSLDLNMDHTPDFDTLDSPTPDFDIFSFVLNEDAKGKGQETEMAQVQLEMGDILGAGASVNLLDDIFGIPVSQMDTKLESLTVDDSSPDNAMEFLRGLQVEQQVLTMVPTASFGEAEGRNRRKSNPGGPSTRVEEVVFEESMTPKEESVPMKRGSPKIKTPKVPRVKKSKTSRPKNVIKMHTLDINEHPEAKNAVAARLRRERDNKMKQGLRDEVDEWKAKYFAEERLKLALEEKLRLAEVEIRRFKGNTFQNKKMK